MTCTRSTTMITNSSRSQASARAHRPEQFNSLVVDFEINRAAGQSQQRWPRHRHDMSVLPRSGQKAAYTERSLGSDDAFRDVTEHDAMLRLPWCKTRHHGGCHLQQETSAPGRPISMTSRFLPLPGRATFASQAELKKRHNCTQDFRQESLRRSSASAWYTHRDWKGA